MLGVFESRGHERFAAGIVWKSLYVQQQMQVRTLLNSRKERQRLQDLKSAHPHPTKRTNDGGREEKQLTEKMYVKNKQRHISMHEYMSNKKKNSKTKTSKKNVVSNRNKRRR